MWLDRPSSDELIDWCGYVRRIAVEQEDEHDQVWFRMETFWEYGGRVISEEFSFCMYLDIGTTVALAQLQLLRDAMEHGYLVRIHTNNSESTAAPSSTLNNYVYWIQVRQEDYYPVTYNDLYL